MITKSTPCGYLALLFVGVTYVIWRPFMLIRERRELRLRQHVVNEMHRQGRFFSDMSHIFEAHQGCLISERTTALTPEMVWWYPGTIDSAIAIISATVRVKDVSGIYMVEPSVLDQFCSPEDLDIGSPILPIPCIVLVAGAIQKVIKAEPHNANEIGLKKPGRDPNSPPDGK